MLLKDWERLSSKVAAGVGRMRVPGNSVPRGLHCQELLVDFRYVPPLLQPWRGVGVGSLL